MTQHITLGGLPLVNLKRKPFRTAALTIVVVMLTVAFYGGSLLSMNLEAGLNSMQERMGADLMVTPQNTKNEAEALLTNGSASTFYFTNEITDEVAKADGIDEITEQTYISSLAAACCDEKVQIIGFNPDTDFVITPWIASQFDGTLQRGQIVAGASISVSGNNTVKLYGHEFPVAAQLANTGTSLDDSVFVNMQTVPDVVGYSAKVGHAAIPEEYADKAVSAVLIKVQGRLLRPAGRFEHHQNNRNQKPRIRISGGHHSHNEIQSERDHSLRDPFRRGVLGHGADRAACCVLVRHERTQT